MKHARTVAKAAAISVAFIALSNGADAALLTGTWYGVISSVNPGTGPFTRSVTADATQSLMTVSWQCGQPTPCSVTGAQYEISPQQHIMALPEDVMTPAPLFVLSANPDCAARYGPTARIGVWLTRQSVPVVMQCFTTMRFVNIPPGARRPPIRLAPITLPPYLLKPAPRP